MLLVLLLVAAARFATRADAQQDPTVDPAPTLNRLSLTGQGALTPAFDPAVTSYTKSIPFSEDHVTLHYSSPTAGAEIEVRPWDSRADAGTQIDLDIGTTTITVKVTAGGRSTTYTIVVTRAAPSAQQDATLSAITFTDVTGHSNLEPRTVEIDDFSPGRIGYSVFVHFLVNQITVAATTTQSDATYEVRGKYPSDNEPWPNLEDAAGDDDIVDDPLTPEDETYTGKPGLQVNLKDGATQLNFVVTADDGTTEVVYTVILHRGSVGARQ